MGLRFRGRPLAHDRHQRHNAGAAADKQNRPAVLSTPYEVAADRTTHLDGIARSRYFVKERRDFAILKALDGELDVLGTGRRGDGVAPLRLITVRCRQADVDGASSQT